MTPVQQAWSARSEALPGIGGLRYTIALGSSPAGFADILHAWRENAKFRAWFNDVLANIPYSAFRWETLPVTTTTLSRPFEFVVLDSPDLAGRPDPDAFAEHFAGAESEVIVFPNLGGDAMLIVPCPMADPSAYGHLAAFVRHAPASQRDALWQSVGETMIRHVSGRPVWLSTAGGGVAWLHVRIDNQPKYYGFAPYQQP